MEKIDAVIFDLYGTLIDITNKTNPYSKLFNAYCSNETTSKIAKKFALTNDFSSLSELLLTLKQDKTFNTSTYEWLVSEEINSVRAYSETFLVLEELKEKDVRLGLISNLASPYKKPFFDLGLDQYFDCMIFSCDVGFKKPDSEIYELAIKELRTQPNNILMVGDHPINDYKKPVSFGMNALHLNRKMKEKEKDTIYSLNGVLETL
ncbi:hypothetical protein C0585_01980 [Candidatus Woesearchaeota archaeon]|nr:MAG: hypothetical protein C0585_01980 [Candidatus Woesearchaeota archaeon]